MKYLSMDGLRRDAELRLRAYRRTCMTLRGCKNREPNAPRTPPPAILKQMRLDKRVVDRVRLYLKKTNPVMERFMVRYFFLLVPECGRRMSRRALHVKLMEEYNVSDSTLYKWKAEILTLTAMQSIEEGLVRLSVPESGEECESEPFIPARLR